MVALSARLADIRGIVMNGDSGRVPWIGIFGLEFVVPPPPLSNPRRNQDQKKKFQDAINSLSS